MRHRDPRKTKKALDKPSSCRRVPSDRRRIRRWIHFGQRYIARAPENPLDRFLTQLARSYKRPTKD